MAIVTSGKLQPIATPQAKPFSVNADISKIAYRDTSYFGASASGNALAQENYLSDFVFWTVSNPDDKVRSSLRVGIGDIFTGFGAADVSSSETFFDKKIQPSEVVEYRDVFNRPLLNIQQRSVQTSDDLRTYTYESILTRLNNTFPASFAQRAVDMPGGPTSLSAGAWLKALFDEWASVYPWFRFEVLPELYPRGSSELRVGILTIFQNQDSPRSMRQIIDDFLGLFEGYRLTVTASNTIKIQAPVWSPAYSSGTKVLEWEDLYTYPISLPQDYAIFNKVTVQSEGFSFVAEQVITAPAYVPRDFIGGDNSANYPNDREEHIYDLIPIAENTLIDESEVSVDLQCELYEDTAYRQTQSTTLSLKKNVTIYHKFTFTNPFATPYINITWAVTFNGDGIHCEVTNYTESKVFGSTSYMGYILLVDVSGKKWQPRGTQVSGSWGIENTQDQLPDLQSSVDTFGEREYTLKDSFLGLEAEQLVQIAKATVDALMRPTTRFRVELSIWNQFATLTPGDIGQAVMLPTGLEGVLTDFIYSDDYDSDTPAVGCVAEVTITEEL